jgi:PAS domain S-box-containing protein
VLEDLPDLDSFLGPAVVGSLLGVIIAANSEAEKLFGFSKTELVGAPITLLMPEPFKSLHDGYLFRHEKFGTEKLLGKTRELMGEHKEGHPFPLMLSLGKLQFDGYFIATFKAL